MGITEEDLRDLPAYLRKEPSRPMDKDELRAAVDILWDSLPNCYNMDGVNEKAWKEEHYKKMISGTNHSPDRRLTYTPKNKSDD